MHHDRYVQAPGMVSRRDWLARSTVGLAALSAGAIGPRTGARDLADDGPSSARGKPTRFQIACMTLPYSRFPLERALSGLKAAGYSFVAWGTTHRDGTGEVPVMAADAPPERAKELASEVPRPGPRAAVDVLDGVPGGRPTRLRSSGRGSARHRPADCGTC